MPAQADRLTRDEAAARAEQVSNVAYSIHLGFESQAKAFGGDVVVEFDHAGGDTFLELIGGDIERLEVNGTVAEPQRDGARLTLPADALGDRNRVRVVYRREYDTSGEGIHHFTDPEDGREYLYTQFESYGAHRLFPCFDQPDLKATYRLTVDAPAEWVVLSASAPEGTETRDDGRTRTVFEQTVPFSTYLFSVVAGHYAGVASSHGDIPLGLWSRRSLLGHLEKDTEELFGLTAAGIDFFGEFFAEPYPFTKYDQIFVPEFNWGGMENVGNVTYTDTVVFRDPPTPDQVLRRAEYFMHELAHMWFGDLVTMKWWDDIWLNESFASYVAYLGLDALGDHEAWQDFHTRMKLWAYAEDQLPTTHRIANEVPSTDETFLNFDGITYGKGAATLKQLVRAVGPDAFRAGLRTYFRRHRFGNATLADFLAAIQEGSGADLVSWAARWLKTPSLNTLAVSWEADGETITRLELRQSAPENHPHLRPHHVDIGLLSAEGELATVPAVVEEVVADVPEAEGMAVPAFVYPNVGDHGYALVALDDRSVDFAMEGLASISDVLLRQQTWGALHEMVRDGSLSSLRFLQLVDRHLPGESSLPILAQLARLVPGTVARFVPEDEIDAAASRFVETARAAIDAAARDDLKVLWARALLGLVTTEADARLAAELIDHPPAGLQVDQDMRWSVAIRWSSLGLEGAAERVAAERERDPSDRGGRAGLTARASRPDAGVKQEVWDRIYGDGYESLTTMRAAAAGFWRRTQRDLLEGFIEPYFATLAEQFAAREVETGKALVTVFFPRHRVDEDMRAAISGVLDAGGVGPVLERLLVEVDDRLRRAIACRAVAAGDL